MCKRILSATVFIQEETHVMAFSSGINILYGQNGEDVLLTLAGIFGGKQIKSFQAELQWQDGVTFLASGEDGHVFVSATDQEAAKRAIFTIKTIVEDPEEGANYKGRVTRLMNFGAFVEIAPGKEGLVHISKLDTKRVEHVEDVVAVGDELIVMVTEIDQQGRINLSRRDALAAIEAKKKAEAAQQ